MPSGGIAGMSQGNALVRGRRRGVNQGQEFVISRYTPGSRNFDALIFGYYEGDSLIYLASTRNSNRFLVSIAQC